MRDRGTWDPAVDYELGDFVASVNVARSVYSITGWVPVFPHDFEPRIYQGVYDKGFLGYMPGDTVTGPAGDYPYVCVNMARGIERPKFVPVENPEPWMSGMVTDDEVNAALASIAEVVR